MSNQIAIPITIKEYKGYTIRFRTRNDLVFPATDEVGDRMLRIGSFIICDYDHSASFVKEGQKIELERPFCFDGQLGKNVIELNEDSYNELDNSAKTPNAKMIPVYLAVDCIDELNGLQNLENEYKFTLKWTESTVTPASNMQNEAGEQTIRPYVAPAIPDFEFVPSVNCLPAEGTNLYSVIYTPRDTAGYRFHVGNIVIRNLQAIPYWHPDGELERLLYPNLRVRLTYELQNARRRSVGYMDVDGLFVDRVAVAIPNGGADVSYKVYIDWKKWIMGGNPTSLLFRVFAEENRADILYECGFNMKTQYYDDVYALDLGTSGIVVAMQANSEISLLKLRDQDIINERIEKDDAILSSVSIMKKHAPAADDVVTVELAPRKSAMSDDSVHIMVPLKFIVGQKRIPFLSYNEENLNLESVRAYGNEETIDMRLIGEAHKDEETINTFISYLYKDVFSRFGKKPEEVKKIIVTYPNTYTQDTLEGVKCILKENLGLNSPGQISFVPESDAVAAFYFNQRIYNGGFPKERERVIIYDMGAGTLDLSLVEFCRGNDGHHTVRILNKIGIPVAGNYLDYIIYRGIEKYVSDVARQHTGQIYLKEAVADFKRNIPENVTDNEQIGALQGGLKSISEDYISSENKSRIQNATYGELFGEELKDYLEVCSSIAIDTLLADYKDRKPDTIVFSGRGSQFLPLKRKVIEYLKKNNPNVKEDIISGGTDNGLKVCVAEGAIRYMELFDEHSPHRIENRNQYANIAVVYWGGEKDKPGIYDVQVRYLLKPNDPKTNWRDAVNINGTICRDFHCNVTLDNIVSGTRVYYVQTFLDEPVLKELFRAKYPAGANLVKGNRLRLGFVNILFDSVIHTGGTEIDVELEITMDNVITRRRVGSNELGDERILENVESNELYRHSMWPNV